MQPRGINTTMEIQSNENVDESKLPPTTSRSRHSAKLKVLVRSHAMREETSPPREPSPNQISTTTPSSTSSSSSPPPPTTTTTTQLIQSPQQPQQQSLLTTMTIDTNPVLYNTFKSLTPPPFCSSPTSTLVPFPNNSRCSPQSASPQHSNDNERLIYSSDTDTTLCSPKYLNHLNKQNLEKELSRDISATSYVVNMNNNISKKKFMCDCQTQNCNKCLTAQESNVHNFTNNNNNFVVGSSTNNTLTVSRVNSRGKLRQQSSSLGSFEGSSSNSPCLSRDNSSEQYTDASGINLDLFIPETLNRSAKDRATMLRIEQELVSLAKDKFKTHFKFPPMSSYQRMLVHRCAAYFGMDHNIDASSKCVLVNKTRNTRIPDKEFKEHIKEDIVFSEEPRRSILKRDLNSAEEYGFKSPDRQSLENRRSKSIEEREQEYVRARQRIFNRDQFRRKMNDESCSTDDFQWSEIQWSSTESDINLRYNKLQPTYEHHRKHFGKLIKVQSEEMGGETLRPCVAKSYSFGGYAGVLNRGDSIISTHSAGPRLLTKQDSAASSVSFRLSPLSSGYKSQSQMSDSVTPSPTSTPHPITEENNKQDLPNPCNDNNSPDKDDTGDTSIIWAVTNIERVPKGSIIIDPQTGEQFRNTDGSVYHYDPNNPPPMSLAATKPPLSPKKSNSSSPQKNNNNSSSNYNNNNNNNNNNGNSDKELSQSPKKLNKPSPNHKLDVTNSSTSPGLPYTPPIQQSPQPTNRNFQFISNLNENLTLQAPVTQQQQQYTPVYGNGYVPPQPPGHDGGVQVYQHPCFIYTPQYGLSHFETRLEPAQLPDVAGPFYIPDNTASQAAQNITYQQPAYWNQQNLHYFPIPATPANSTPQQRFTIPLHGGQGQTGFIPSYTQNYLPTPANPEVVPIYTNQPVQMVPIPPPPPQMVPVPPPPPQPPINQPNTLLYQTNQPNIIYTPNPLYTNPTVYTQQYPQNTPTPNSSSSLSTTHTNLPEHPNFIQLPQNMAQMSITSPQGQIGSPNQHNFLLNNHNNGGNNNNNNNNNNNKTTSSSQTDIRQMNNSNSIKTNKFNNMGKSFIINSSQSSTGTSSPATTVVSAAGYCPQNYKTPPETPPAQFNYGPNFSVPPPPVLFRPISNVRTSTPGTARSSRSPTPANDFSHFERQKIPLHPSQLYHGMPYVFPSRGQYTAYRQPAPMRHQRPDNRSHRGRKSKTNKSTSNLPSNGKPV